MNEEDLKNYDKKIYGFTQLELSKLMPWDTQIQIGAIAEKVLAGILRTECLKRVGVKNSPDTKVEYDFVTGNFTAYVPKIWCSQCKNRMAEFTYENKPYCTDCAKLLRKEMDKKEPVKKGKKK
jgi:hypothetical protein